MVSLSRLKLAILVAAVCLVGTPGAAERDHPAGCTPPATLTCEQLVALGYAYPYAREAGSYLFVNGAAYRCVDPLNGPPMYAPVQVGSKVVTAAKLLKALGRADHIPRRRRPVIGYGSNAAVSALTRKYVAPGVPEPAVIPVTRAWLSDYDGVWSPHLAFNGAMPATIVPPPGTVVEVWITWLDDLELRRMNQTEGVGTRRDFSSASPLTVPSTAS